MRSSNLKIILFVIAILLCTSSILFSQEKPAIKVVMMTGPDQEGWSQVAEIYTKETGYPVIVEGQGRGEYHASLPTQLFSRSKAFDIVWILDTWIPEFAEAGVLMPLDEYTQDPEYDASDLLPVGVYKGIRYAVPVDYSHFYIYYRNDLIQEAPQTWDELYETANKFSKAINPDSPTKYGITGDYITGEVLPQTWFNILWSFGGDVIDENGNVIVNNEKAIMAAKIWEKWAKEGILPPNITQLGWNDHVDQFVNGDAAIIVPGWNAGYYDIPRHSGPYANSWTAALLPGYKLEDGSINRTIYVQSWSFAVNAASEHKEEAASHCPPDYQLHHRDPGDLTQIACIKRTCEDPFQHDQTHQPQNRQRDGQRRPCAHWSFDMQQRVQVIRRRLQGYHEQSKHQSPRNQPQVLQNHHLGCLLV